MANENSDGDKSLQPIEGQIDAFRDKLAIVIDDDALVLQATGGLLRSWGFDVLTASSEVAVVEILDGVNRPPDLIICDYRLSNGASGIKVAELLCSVLQSPIPTLIVSGDTFPDHLRTLCADGHHVLHKPLSPEALRTALERLLRAPRDR